MPWFRGLMTDVSLSYLCHTGDWKRMPEFDRLLIFRTLRPDRLTAAMARFVANTLGEQYITSQPFDLERSFQASPMFLASAAI